MPLSLLLGHLIVVVEIVRNGIGLGVIIVRNQAIIRRLAGSFMANLLIGNQSHGLTEMAKHTWLPTLRAHHVPEPSPFNKEQMEMLQKLLSQVGSGSTTGIAFTANRGGMKLWIVDTGASDHMTGDAVILQNYKPSNGHSSVHIADGSKSKIAETGSIKLTKTCILTLSSMFQTWIVIFCPLANWSVISNVLLNFIQTRVFFRT